MTRLPSSMSWQGGWICLMRSFRQESSSVPSTAPPSSMVVIACHDDHQKVKGFLSRHGSWDLVPHLMHNGGVLHIMATWRALTSGVNAPLVWFLGSPLVLSFLCLVFKLPFFYLSPSLFPLFRLYCSMLLLLRAVLPCDFLELFLSVVAFFEVCLFSHLLCSL